VTKTAKANEGVNVDQTTATSTLDIPIQGDRRQVTIIFADISGFTALNDAAKTAADVEQVVKLINMLLSELSEVIYEYDGYIDKYVGDEIMALFGAPVAHENDPELALRAALAMMERLQKFNENPPIPLPAPLGIHMGINTGTVIACMVGTGRKSSYTVMCDAVNVASRLEAASERGQIMVNEDTYNLTNRLFVFEECEPITVKGKSEPLNVYLLKGARDLSQTQRGLTGMEAPLIGREHEMEQLLNYYQKLYSRQGSAVAVVGDAGLGKSRLIAELMKQVNREEREEEGKPKSLWLFGRGLSYRQSFANRLFVDILYSYLGLPENSDHNYVKVKLEAMGEELFGKRKNEVIPYLATLLGVKWDNTSTDLPLNDPQLLQQRIFLAMGEWVEVLAAKQPLVVVFEDLHWADPSSVALIDYLFSLTVYTPILIICVSRIERNTSFWKIKTQSAQDHANIAELTLWPLTNEECRQVIKHLLKIDSMPAALEHLLLSRAEGNPLFLEEVLRSLIEEGAIEHKDGHWEVTRAVTDIDIPNTLQGVLTARIDRLDERVRRILQIAAVIGRVFPRFILAPIVNEPDDVLEKALEQLEIADLIEVKTREPEPEYIFKHILTYETAYQSMLHQQRQMIHKQIGDHMSRQYWLLGEEYAPIVAEHYYKSETWDRALRYYHRAVVAAIQSFANEKAVEYCTRALEVADIIGPAADSATVLAVYESRAKMLTRLGEPQQAMADYEAMLIKAREVNDDAAQMRALNGNGALQASHHNFTLASEYFQKALAVARRIGDGQGIADTLNQLGNFYYNMGELEFATTCYRESRDLSKEANNELYRIAAEDGLAKIMLEQGEIMASLDRYQEEIIPVCRRLGYRGSLMSSLYSVLMAQVFTANYAQADETAQELLELHKKFGDFYRIPLIKYYHALGQLYQGYLGEAYQNLTQGLEMAQEQEQKSSQALGLAWLGYYYLILGKPQEGLQQAEQSVQLAHELGSPLYEMKAQAILGTAYRHLNRLDEAIKGLEEVHTGAHDMGFTVDEVMILYQLARAFIDKGEWAKAEQALQNLIALAKANEMHEFVARSYWLKSITEVQHGRYEAALETLIQASNLAQEIDGRLTQYLIQIQKAYVYQLTGNDAALRDAIIYAQRIQKKLIESLPDEASQQVFMSNAHALHLQEINQAAGKKSA